MTTAPTDTQTPDTQPTDDDSAGLDVLFGRSRVIPPPLSPDPAAAAAAAPPPNPEPEAPPTYASMMGNLPR